MGTLLSEKQWVTITGAAKNLAMSFSEEITEADIYRFFLNGDLDLSVSFIKIATARPGKIVVSGPSGVGTRFDENAVIQLDDKYVKLTGTYKLSLSGNGRTYIEDCCKQLLGVPVLTTINIGGVFVTGDGNSIYQIQQRFPAADLEELKIQKGSKLPYKGFYPAERLPEHSIMVVRTEDLAKLIQSPSGKGHAKIKSAPTKTERADRMSLQIDSICEGLERSGQPITHCGVWSELIKSIGEPGSCCFQEEQNPKGNGMVIAWFGIQGNVPRLTHGALKGRLTRRKSR